MINLENIILQLKENSLQKLNLWDDNIGDSGAIAIAETLKINTSLWYLNLGGNNIGDQGVIAIADALKANTSLRILKLADNNIGDQGAISIGEALKVNTSLQELWLWRSDIGEQGEVAIGEALKVNTSLQKLDLVYIINAAFQKSQHVDQIYLERNKLIKQNTINQTQILSFYFKKLDNIRLFRSLFRMHSNKLNK